MEFIYSIFPHLLFRGPVILVWACGAVFAMLRGSRDPRVARLAIVGCVGAIGAELIGMLSSIMTLVMFQQGRSAQEVGMAGLVVGPVKTFVEAVSYGLVLYAALAARPAAAAETAAPKAAASTR